MIDEAADGYSAEINQKAIDSYQPDMFVEETSSVAASSETASSEESTDSTSEASSEADEASSSEAA